MTDAAHRGRHLIAPHFDNLRVPTELRALRTGVDGENYLYTRYGTPASIHLEAQLRAYFLSAWSLVTASGMAAVDLAVSLALRRCPQERPILAVSEDLYVGSRRYFERILGGFRRQQVVVRVLEHGAPDAVLAQLRAYRPDILFAEAITNPLLGSAEVNAIAEYKRNADCFVILDGSLSPEPALAGHAGLGDVQVFSATKYFCAHNDTLGGIVTCNDPALYEHAFEYRKFVGCVLADEACVRLSEDLSTLQARFANQKQNAQRAHELLQSQRGIGQVWSHGGAALVTWEFAEERGLAAESLGALFHARGLHFAVSFGSAHTTATPVGLLDSRFARRPMVRLSCGTEHGGEFIAMLGDAFDRLLS